MRFIVSVDNQLVNSNITQRLRDGITKKLRRVWLDTGLDYTGLEIRGIHSNARNIASMDEFWADVAAVDGQPTAIVKRNTRLVISDHNLNIDSARSDDETNKLLLTVDTTGTTSWGPGGANTHADLHFTDEDLAPYLEAAVTDVFQDIMTANSSLISDLVSRFLDTGGTLDEFFEMKAKFAADRAGTPPQTSLFPTYSPARYGCFATLARNSLVHGPVGFNAKTYASIWEDFVLTKLVDVIPTTKDITPYLINGRFRRPDSSETDAEGRTKGKRIAFPTIPRAQLDSILNDRQIITRTAAYVMFIQSKVPSNNVDELGALMGWKNEKAKKIKKIKLAHMSCYPDYAKHVHSGHLTPIRLFLKAGS